MDPIFNRQSFRWYEQTRKQLKKGNSDLAKAQLEFFDLMRGPWDRQEEEKPFAVDYERPPGGGGYPMELTKEEKDGKKEEEEGEEEEKEKE